MGNGAGGTGGAVITAREAQEGVTFHVDMRVSDEAIRAILGTVDVLVCRQADVARGCQDALIVALREVAHVYMARKGAPSEDEEPEDEEPADEDEATAACDPDGDGLCTTCAVRANCMALRAGNAQVEPAPVQDPGFIGKTCFFAENAHCLRPPDSCQDCEDRKRVGAPVPHGCGQCVNFDQDGTRMCKREAIEVHSCIRNYVDAHVAPEVEACACCPIRAACVADPMLRRNCVRWLECKTSEGARA